MHLAANRWSSSGRGCGEGPLTEIFPRPAIKATPSLISRWYLEANSGRLPDGRETATGFRDDCQCNGSSSIRGRIETGAGDNGFHGDYRYDFHGGYHYGFHGNHQSLRLCAMNYIYVGV